MWEIPTYLEISDSFRIIPVSLPYPPPTTQFNASLLLKSSNELKQQPSIHFYPKAQREKERELLLSWATLESPIRKIQHSGRISLQWYTQLKINSHNYSPTQLLASPFLSFFSFPSFLLTSDFSNLTFAQMHHNEEQWNVEQTKQQNKPCV